MMPRPGDTHIGRGQSGARPKRNGFLESFGTKQVVKKEKMKDVVYNTRSHRKGALALTRGLVTTVNGKR